MVKRSTTSRDPARTYMRVTAGHIVRIDCELRVSGGDIIESSKKTGPVEYKQGGGQMLAALDVDPDSERGAPEEST